MKSLRQHVRQLQVLENEACEKAGMRFRLLDELKVFGKGGKKYIADFIDQLQRDIAPEVLKAAKLGKELKKEITGGKEK